MTDRTCILYAALALVYCALTAILLADNSLPHAACAGSAAALYAGLAFHHRGPRGGRPSGAARA